ILERHLKPGVDYKEIAGCHGPKQHILYLAGAFKLRKILGLGLTWRATKRVGDGDLSPHVEWEVACSVRSGTEVTTCLAVADTFEPRFRYVPRRLDCPRCRGAETIF